MDLLAGTRALVVGEALIDLTVRADGSETAYPGGSPLNVAVGLSRLGARTTLAAQVGDDDHGEMLRDHVDASDVDLRSLPPHRGDSATAVATLDRDGAATYAFDLDWGPAELPAPDDFDVVHVGSIGAALAPGADAVEGLVRRCREVDVPVSYDPNVRIAITPDVDDVRRRFRTLASLATVVKCSDEDLDLLSPGAAVEDFAAEVLTLGASLVAVTSGGSGAYLASTAASVRVPAPSAEVADTIGAGDSFMAALLAALAGRGLLRDAPGEDDLRWLGDVAVSAAAITCSRFGADPPTRAEVPHLG